MQFCVALHRKLRIRLHPSTEPICIIESKRRGSVIIDVAGYQDDKLENVKKTKLQPRLF